MYFEPLHMKTQLQFLSKHFLLTVKYSGGFLRVWMRVLLPCSFFMVQYSFKCERNVFQLNRKKKPVDVYMENISNVNALALNHLIAPVKSVTQKWSDGQEPTMQQCPFRWLYRSYVWNQFNPILKLWIRVTLWGIVHISLIGYF